MKRLTRYYLLIGIPFILLLLAAIAFIDEIASTVRGNPHPQINYAIFVLLFMGSLLMLAHVRRINTKRISPAAFFANCPTPRSAPMPWASGCICTTAKDCSHATTCWS